MSENYVRAPRKRWLSVTTLIDALVSHGIMKNGQTLTVYFDGYGTKTRYHHTWYIRPYEFHVEETNVWLDAFDIDEYFPGFTFLNLTKTSFVNPTCLMNSTLGLNRAWCVTIDTNSREFIGNDGNSHRYFNITMKHVEHNEVVA